MKLPEIDDLKTHLSYDENTGLFTWIVPTNPRIKVGSNAGVYRNDKRNRYQYLRFRGQIYLGHRLAWFYVFGKWPSTIDHVNGDKRDNRLCNLREVTPGENMQNQSAKGKGRSGLIGAIWNERRSKWFAQITVGRKCIHLGSFDDKNDAHRAYVEAKKTYHAFQPTLSH